AVMPLAAKKAAVIDTTPVEPIYAARTLSSIGKASGAVPVLRAEPVTKTGVVAKNAPAQNTQQQLALAAGAAVRLGVNAEGWYRATQAQLVAAGLSASVDPKKLQLYLNGVEQPI